MRFFKPSIGILLPPIVIVALSFLNSLALQELFFKPLSIPIQPLIHHLGLVYSDKPIFLTPKAAQLTAVIWAPVIYVLLCLIRHWRNSNSEPIGKD